LIVVVLGVEFILTPPTELELAQWTLHELAASSMSYEHLAPRAFLAPEYFVKVAEQ
jgi:hypothetical protein